MKMSSKILLLVLGLLALGCTIEARSFLKRLQQKHLASAVDLDAGAKALEHVRRRRDAEENASEEMTDQDAAALMKFFVAIAWISDKEDVISGFVEEMADSDSNVTIIGWQRILDEAGQVKEVNSVQLVIPPKPVKDGHKAHDDDDDDDDDDEDSDRIIPYSIINELKEILEPLAQMGIPASITLEEYEKDGDQEVLIYMDKDELYIKAEGFAIYNTTIEASPEEVQAFIKKHKSTHLGEPAVLRYDVDGHLDKDQSTINPHFLGCVIDHYEAPDEVLIESPNIIAHVSQFYPKKDVPQHLAEEYNNKFPDYKWRVLADPGHYYVTRDVALTLSYDNFDYDETSNVNYVVYGIKKASATN